MTKRSPQQSGDQEQGSGESPASGGPAQSSNAGTNLVIADIIVCGASKLLRQDIVDRLGNRIGERMDGRMSERIGDRGTNPDQQDLRKLDGKAILTTLGLYGATKLANRSGKGLALVAGGLVAKALYERGKARQKRKSSKVSVAQTKDAQD